MSVPATDSDFRTTSDPTGLHRVLDDAVVLPQAAQRLDTRRELWPDEVRVRVETLNLDAASFRQLEGKHAVDGTPDGDAVRREVLQIVSERGKMQNPVTGSGGMLVGTVEEVGPESPLGLEVGDHVATLVSLSLTPLVIEDALERWLANPPSRQQLLTDIAALNELSRADGHVDGEFGADEEQLLLAWCQDVADAAGGLFGLRSPRTDAETAALKAIAAALDLRTARQWRALLDR